MIINDDITNPDYIGMIQVLWLKKEREREKKETIHHQIEEWQTIRTQGSKQKIRRNQPMHFEHFSLNK